MFFNSIKFEVMSEVLIVELLFFGFLSFVILVGNILVCIVIYKIWKFCIKINYYLVLFVVVDIMVGVFFVFYWIYFRLGKVIYNKGCSCLEVMKGYIKN